MPVFKESQSTLLRFAPLPAMELEHANDKANDNGQVKQNWFQSRFGKEHAFGSIMLLINLISSSLLISAAKSEKDYFRVSAGVMASAITAWTFLSSRGGKMPEGETFLQRAKNAILHPSESAVHFAMLSSIIVTTLATIGHFNKGFSGDPAERTRVASGELGFLSIGMMTTGLFKQQKKEILEDESIQQKPSAGVIAHAKELYRYAWKLDKRGVVGRYISMGNQLCDLSEGFVKRGVQGKSSSKLIASAIIDMSLLIGQSLYFYEQLMKGQKKAQQPESNTQNKQEPAAVPIMQESAQSRIAELAMVGTANKLHTSFSR